MWMDRLPTGPVCSLAETNSCSSHFTTSLSQIDFKLQQTSLKENQTSPKCFESSDKRRGGKEPVTELEHSPGVKVLTPFKATY